MALRKESNVKKHARLRFAGLAIGFSAAACTTSGDDSADESGGGVSAFSVLPTSASLSLLPAIEDSHGHLPVCVGLVGFDQTTAETVLGQVEANITTAMTMWNKQLQGDPLWTLDGDVSPTYSVQVGQCTRVNPQGLNVNVWATVDQFKTDWCLPNFRDVSLCASGALMNKRTFGLGPWNRGQPDDVIGGSGGAFTALHELGHLLGLGDTYKTAGINDWTGEQPPSIMNGGSRTELTDDDKLGVLAVLRALKTGKRDCDGFGDSVQMTANTFGAFLCSPSAQPVDTHGRTTVQPAVVLPRAGMWAYEGSDPNVNGLLIQEVDKTGTGFNVTVAAVANGTAASPARYVCTVVGACAAQTDPAVRILVSADSTLRFIDPSAPAGLVAHFDHEPQ
jgi:hypothetical protein